MSILTASNDYGSSDAVKNQYITVAGTLNSRFAADPLTGKAP